MLPDQSGSQYSVYSARSDLLYPSCTAEQITFLSSVTAHVYAAVRVSVTFSETINKEGRILISVIDDERHRNNRTVNTEL